MEKTAKGVEPIKIKVPHGQKYRVGNTIFNQNTTVYKCGVCRTFLPRWAKHCPGCGEKIDWQKTKDVQ